MSSETQELLDICEQLPDVERAEVADMSEGSDLLDPMTIGRD